MSATQKQAVRAMNGAGAVWVPSMAAWVWRCDVRESESVAAAVVAMFARNARPRTRGGPKSPATPTHEDTMTAARVYVSLDDTLKQMRAELHREFPGIKFSVRRDHGTAYGYVDVRWTDGPTADAVRHITSGYEGQGFDGMTDSSYTIEHTSADANGNPTRVKYAARGIACTRTISAALANQCIAQIVAYWGGITTAPVATPSGWGDGYELDRAFAYVPIRPDLSDLDWHTAISRCAGDPDLYTHAEA